MNETFDEKVVELVTRKSAGRPMNTTIDFGCIKDKKDTRRKTKSWAPQSSTQTKLEGTHLKRLASSPPPSHLPRSMSLKRSPANYQLERIKYHKRLL